MTAHPEAPPGLQGATVTITGGTGSFGSTMAMDLLRKGVGTINIFSRDEAKQDAMRRRIDDPRVRYLIGDVRDPDRVERATLRDSRTEIYLMRVVMTGGFLGGGSDQIRWGRSPRDTAIGSGCRRLVRPPAGAVRWEMTLAKNRMRLVADE